MTQRAQVALTLTALLLCVPALTVLSQTLDGGRQWLRMHREHKRDLESRLERLYRTVFVEVPERSVVGLVTTPTTSTIEKERTKFFMSYTLAPRQIVLSADAPWVVLAGPSGPDDLQLLGERRFVLVSAPREDLRLYRRIAP